MKKKKPKFNSKMRMILQELSKSRRGLSIYEISQNTGVSWVTVKKYIKYLNKKGLIYEKRKNG